MRSTVRKTPIRKRRSARYTSYMRDAVIIFIAIILAMAIGGYLFFNGGPTFNPDTSSIPGVPDAPFTVIAEGQNAGGVERRVNYRIMTDEELVALWSLVYGQSGPAVPVVNFSRDEVIAVFNGSHSSGGHRVQVVDVSDADGKRTLRILRESPGEGCAVTEAITSPFQIVKVSKTTLPIERVEEERIIECGP